MKGSFISGLFILTGLNVFCQLKEIRPAKVFAHYNYFHQYLYDSANRSKVTPYYPLEMYGFQIKINRAYFDEKSGEMQLIGQVYMGSDTTSSIGLPNVDIFKARKNQNDFLENRIDLGASSDNGDSWEKNGFFDIKFKIEKGESLFFFITYFFLREFKLGELLK